MLCEDINENTGKKTVVVSHGIDENDNHVILPCDAWHYARVAWNAKFDDRSGEWYMETEE